MDNTSPKYTLDVVDLWKIVRGAGVTLLGALITYVGTVYLNVDYTVTLGGHALNFTSVAIVAISALLETGRRFVTDHTV